MFANQQNQQGDQGQGSAGRRGGQQDTGRDSGAGYDSEMADDQGGME